MKPTRVLTGITTTGSPHLGNYVGAIRPAVAASAAEGVESFFFLADYHALVKCEDAERVRRSTLEIAASWLACGLDPERVFFYRQSDIAEIPELTWILACSAAKGLLNRAHAYKAAVDDNTKADEDPDAGINMGLYLYPVLMAADILAFNAHRVPVGRDQIQHIEMARDIAARFNHRYQDLFTLPEAQVDANVAVLPGLDGRKMSKSYDNTIGLWLPERELKSAIARIITDSRQPGEAKDTDGSAVFELYRAFASDEETAAMREAFADGISWGEAKRRLFERIDSELKPMRERYYQLISRPAEIEETLRFGGRKARALAIGLVSQVRMAVGIAPLFAMQWQADKTPASDRQAQPRLVTFRQDGRFRFKLLAADGASVLESVDFADPRSCGLAMATVKRLGPEIGMRAVAGAGDGDAGTEAVEVFDPADGSVLAHGADAATARAVLDIIGLL
ncbi:MAG: tryptophan--tRNA ligase [Xanthomonadales bacterium]|nr:tryptophan--tRNA ligase [Xanthomonadales bacterium]